MFPLWGLAGRADTAVRMTTTAVETKSGRIARISNSLIGVSSRCQENTSETALMINTAEHLLADIRELAPVITERATEIEAGGRIPPDLVEALRSVCVRTEGGKPTPGPASEGGPPLLRGVFLPARDWEVEDTWHVAGLKGTGSHHVALRDTMVSAANFFNHATGVPCLPGPLYEAVLQLLPLMLGANSVGMAEGALDELVELANTGRQQLQAAVPMRDSETFQGELGRVAAELMAARAFLEVQGASYWRHALAGTLKDEALLTQSTQTAIWLATTCVRAADACFALGGSSALYETSPLQRRLRDLHTAAQHFSAQPRQYARAGKLLLNRYSIQ